MGWKEWPAWLKGGVILASFMFVIEVFVLIIGSLIECAGTAGTSIGTLCLLLQYLSFAIIPAFFLEFANIHPVFVVLYLIVFWFLIGSLIGWIIGKIKK